jgi:hypothetical protein
MEEKAIHHSKHLDLIYSQFSTLYDLILNAPCPSTNGSHLKPKPHVDGVFGSTSFATIGQLIGQLGKMTISRNPSPTTLITNPNLATTHTSKVNIVQTASSKNPQQLEGKKKNKRKYKKTFDEQGGDKVKSQE